MSAITWVLPKASDMSSGEPAALSEPGRFAQISGSTHATCNEVSHLCDVCSNPADCQPVSTGDTAADFTLPGARSWTDLDASVLFEKVLTSSDINPQGRIVVPKVVTSLLSDTVHSVLDAPRQAIHLQANVQSRAISYLASLRLPYGFTF